MSESLDRSLRDGEAEAMTAARLNEISRQWQHYHSTEHMDDLGFRDCSRLSCMDHAAIFAEVHRLRRVSPALVPTPESLPTRSSEALDELRRLRLRVENLTRSNARGYELMNGEREARLRAEAEAGLLQMCLRETEAERDALLASPVPTAGTAPDPALVALQRLSEAAGSEDHVSVRIGTAGVAEVVLVPNGHPNDYVLWVAGALMFARTIVAASLSPAPHPGDRTTELNSE